MQRTNDVNNNGLIFCSISMRKAIGVFLALLFFSCSVASSEKLPQWELGVGLGGLDEPDYPGADQSSNYAAPFPFFIYRSPKYRIDREGVKGGLIGGENWGIGVSIGGTLPVDSDDNRSRDGMEDLDATLEVGPNPFLRIASSDISSLQIEAPVRPSFSLKDATYQGLTANPRLVWRYRHQKLKLHIAAGAIISNKKFHERIYTVPLSDQTQERSAYAARGGLTGREFSFAFNRRTKHYLWGAFVSYLDLNDAANHDSPLLKSDENIAVGMVITRILHSSKKQVELLEDVNH